MPEDLPRTGIVTASHRNGVTVRDCENIDWHCPARSSTVCAVPGDRVQWKKLDEQCAAILKIDDRHNQLNRPNRSGTSSKTIAANLDYVALVVAPQPAFTLDYIDRCIAVCELQAITIFLVYNKVDVSDHADAKIQSLRSYESLGYRLFPTSVKTGDGMANLGKQITNKTTLLVGQSGVGKSSLVGQLCVDAEPKTGALSRRGGVGKHTTTATRLHALRDGGWIVDSPGVRDFATWHIDKLQLEDGFREVAKHANGCRFRDCLHLHEPGCGVIAAHAAGIISPRRLLSYQSLLSELAPD